MSVGRTRPGVVPVGRDGSVNTSVRMVVVPSPVPMVVDGAVEVGAAVGSEAFPLVSDAPGSPVPPQAPASATAATAARMTPVVRRTLDISRDYDGRREPQGEGSSPRVNTQDPDRSGR